MVDHSEVAKAQQQLDEVTKRFESGFAVYPVDGNHAFSATGEEYIEVGPGILDRATGELNLLFDTPDEAIAAFDKALAGFHGAMGVLFWRIRPEIDVCQEGIAWADLSCIGKWKIYSRFLISDKPAKYPARLSVEELGYRRLGFRQAASEIQS